MVFRFLKDLRPLDRLVLGLVLFVFLFQFLTLNAPGMNGDEANYLNIMDELRRLRHGALPLLNPVTGYEGPLDFWFLGSVYALTSKMPWLTADIWMVRIVPLVIFWAGSAYLYQEVRHYSKPLASWLLLLCAVFPMMLVYSHYGYPHSLLLGAFSVLLAESLFAARTGDVRWLRIGVVAGFAIEAHTTSFVGILVAFLPALPALLKSARRHPGRVFAAALAFGLLAYPVVRNFPPPMAAEAERGHNILLELRNFLNMVSGHQPYKFMLHLDPMPDVLLAVYLLFVPYLFYRGFRSLRSPTDPQTLTFRRLLLAQLGGSLFLAIMCYRGRSLTLIGHERYFMTLVPGWALLFAYAFLHFDPKRQMAWVLAVFFFFFPRYGAPMLRYSFETDSAFSAARWLEAECPPDKCQAFAESFWNYWPIRYYTRDSIDLNFLNANWKPRPTRVSLTLESAGCWLYETDDDLRESRTIYRGPYRSKVVFPPQSANFGEVCFSGILPPVAAGQR